MRHCVVAIDGPAGSGKSTVARALARRLGYGVVPSGLFYRAMAWRALTLGTALDDGEELSRLAERTAIEVREEGGQCRARVDGRDVTAELSSPAVSDAASRASVFPGVRRCMVRLQRLMAERGPVVAEGRDMASAVFPEAEFKFYLDATVGERARRRVLELRSRGEDGDEAALACELAARDRRDATRAADPLCQAPGAVRVDTTDLTVEETVERLLRAMGRSP